MLTPMRRRSHLHSRSPQHHDQSHHHHHTAAVGTAAPNGGHVKGPSSSLVPECGTVTPRSMPPGPRRSQQHHQQPPYVRVPARSGYDGMHPMYMMLTTGEEGGATAAGYSSRGRSRSRGEASLLGAVERTRRGMPYGRLRQYGPHGGVPTYHQQQPRYQQQSLSVAAAPLHLTPSNQRPPAKSKAKPPPSTADLVRAIDGIWAPPPPLRGMLEHTHAPSGRHGKRKASAMNTGNPPPRPPHRGASTSAAAIAVTPAPPDAFTPVGMRHPRTASDDHESSRGPTRAALPLPAFADTLLGAAIADLFPVIKKRQRQVRLISSGKARKGRRSPPLELGGR